MEKYLCNICNKKYKSNKSLWNHNKKFHQIIKKVKNSCKFCNNIFENKNKKYYHQKKCLISINKNENINIPKPIIKNTNIIANNEVTQLHNINNYKMYKGIIYFIQPSELVGTNRYKIGCSKIPNLKRCINGYRKGSRYICIMECYNPLTLEKNIKIKFTKLFKLIAGTEYFEGNEYIMRNAFCNIIEESQKYNNISNSEVKSDSDIYKNKTINLDNINSDKFVYISRVNHDDLDK
jgi:hypothetical protein